MSDDQMEMSELEPEIEEEEVVEEEVKDIGTPIKKPTSSKKKSTRKKKSTTKKSESSGDSKEVKPVAATMAGPTVEVSPLAVSQIRVNVRSLWPARMIVRETPTGEVYVWPKAGALVSVNSVDIEFLMSKNKTGKSGCCGGGPRNYFELA